MKILNKTLSWSHNPEVEGTYIIRIRNHKLSEQMAKRCMDSCEKVGQKAQYWDAFDGTGNMMEGIVVPPHAQEKTWLSWLKQINHDLTPQEVCCLLSHFSLWCRCIDLDRPVVALEHDAVMLQPFTHHMAINSIVYLGCQEMVRSNYWSIIPPHAQLNKDYRHLLRTHAYSIDPCAAKNLVSHVLERGIHTSADCMMSLNRCSFLCFGIYAMDVPGQTTIPELRKTKE